MKREREGDRGRERERESKREGERDSTTTKGLIPGLHNMYLCARRVSTHTKACVCWCFCVWGTMSSRSRAHCCAPSLTLAPQHRSAVGGGKRGEYGGVAIVLLAFSSVADALIQSHLQRMTFTRHSAVGRGLAVCVEMFQSRHWGIKPSIFQMRVWRPNLDY